MPSTHDLNRDETILRLTRLIRQHTRKINALSKRIAALEVTIAKKAEPPK